MSSSLKGGKYAGRSLPQILFLDPDYFFWAVENQSVSRTFGNRGREAIVEGASYQNSQTGSWKLVCWIFLHAREQVLLVPICRPRAAGTCRFKHHEEIKTYRYVRCSWIMPLRQERLQRFIKNLKRHLFGNSATRMTAERCEEFFDDRDNFGSGI